MSFFLRSIIKALATLSVLFFLFFQVISSASAQDGQLDSQFVEDGWLQIPFGREPIYVNDMIQQKDGKLVMVGNVWESNVSRSFSLMRYQVDGTLDESFGQAGIVNDPIDSFSDNAYSVQADAAGNLFVIGVSGSEESSNLVMVKYRPDGYRDTSFANNGVFVFELDSNSYPSDLEVLEDGAVLGLGYSNDKGTFDFLVFKVSPKGELDKSFGTEGYVLVSPGVHNDFARQFHVGTKGAITVAGGSWNGADWDYSVARLDTKGAVDLSFGTDGFAMFSVGKGNDNFGGSVLLSNGAVVLAGSALGVNEGQDFAMVKTTPSGALDTEFGINGKMITPMGPGYDAGRDVIEMPDGGLLVSGHAWQQTEGDFALAKYKANGKLDPSFGVGGKSINDLQRMDNVPTALLLGNNNEIFVIGNSYNGTTTSPTLAKYVSGFEVSIEEKTNQGASISIFPNPVESQFSVDFGDVGSGSYQMTLLDVQGRVIMGFPQFKIEDHRKVVNVMVPTSILPGVYLVEVKGELTYARQRLLKQ